MKPKNPNASPSQPHAAAASTKQLSAPPASRTASTPTNDQIGTRAHAIWLARGQPSGRDLEIWLAAEHELRANAKFAGAENLPAEAGDLDDENNLTPKVETQLNALAQKSEARPARSPTSL